MAADTLAFAPIYFPGTASYEDAAQVTIAPGEERTADFVLASVRAATMTGVVLTPNGAPAPGVTVQVASKSGDWDRTLDLSAAPSFKVTSRGDGSFAVPAIPPGHHQIVGRAQPPLVTGVGQTSVPETLSASAINSR